MDLPPPQGQPQMYPQVQAPYQPSPQQSYDQQAADMTSQMASMSVHPQARAGTTALLTMFGQGNVLVLESRASEKTLRITNDGEVEGLGGRGKLAQFTVHVRRPEVVALQNVNNPDAWLGIIDGKLIGNGTGGPYSEFIVKEIDGKLISLESAMYPGEHVGILPEGTPKPPGNTGTGQHGRFVPILIKDASSSPPTDQRSLSGSSAAVVAGAAAVGAAAGAAAAGGGPPPYTPHEVPPQGMPPQGMPPQGMPPQGMPPQQGYPPATYPQGGYPPVSQPGYPPAGQPGYPPVSQPGYPPVSQPGYPPQAGYPGYQQQQFQQPPPAPVPQGPQLPIGFNVLEAFTNGNVIQLICRGTGYPLHTMQGRINGKGVLGKPLSNWIVEVPGGAAPGVIMFRNEVCKGILINMNKAGCVGAGKGGRFCHFKVEVLPDNYCMFSSVEFPAFHLNFMANGVAGNVKTATATDSSAQFFIRCEKKIQSMTQTSIMTPFGRPSIANHFRDGGLVQLYLRSAQKYLGINKNGLIFDTVNANDPHTFFVVKDRGMGIVSFDTRKFPGYRLRMENRKLVGKGVPDLNSDFRIKDVSDGSVCFESVTNSGSYIGIPVSPGNYQTNLNVALLQIQRFGATENVSRTEI